MLLLLRPHLRRRRLVVPHGVAEPRVHEEVRLVHVADHALRGRDGVGHHVADRMRRLAVRDGRIDGRARAAVAELGIGPRGLDVAVVGIDDVTRGAAGIAIVARVVVRAHEPGEGIVEPRLGDVEDRDRDAQARAGAAVRLADVGPARLLDALELAVRVRQADLGEGAIDVAAAALEHAEDVGGRIILPRRQRIDLRDDAVIVRHLRRRLHRRHFARGLAVLGIGLAQDRMLERHDAVVVGGGAPEMRRRRHERALGRLDDAEMAGAARLARDAIIARILEADEGRVLAIEERVAFLGLGRGRPMPVVGIARRDMGALFEPAILLAPLRHDIGAHHAGIAAVAIGAAEIDARARVHRQRVRLGVAAHAARGLGRGRIRRLHRRRGGSGGNIGSGKAAAQGKEPRRQKRRRDRPHRHRLSMSG